MTRNNFICKVVNELVENDFSVFLHNTIMVEYCGGWFDCYKKEFTVAMKNNLGFQILIHEYSHYLQWKERKRFFNKKNKSTPIVFSWIDGTFYKKDVLDEAFKDVIELEWDCEMHALELIREYELDVDIDDYIKAANAYLLFYNSVRENRSWCKKSPYIPRIMGMMETSMQPLRYYQNPENFTEKLRKEYAKILQ